MKRWMHGGHRLLGSALVAALWLGAAPSVHAQQDDADPPGPDPATQAAEATEAPFDATLTQAFSPPEAPQVGAPLELVLELDHPRGVDVQAPEALETRRAGVVEARLERAPGESPRGQTTITLVIVPWRPGTLELGALPVTLSDDQGRQVALRTEPVSLKIASRLPDDELDPALRPARPPVAVFTQDNAPLRGGLGGLGVALAALGLLALWRRRSDAPPEQAAPLPEHERASEALRALRERDLLERGEYLTFYVRLSEIMRAYLGERYGFPGRELTSFEILERLRPIDLPEGLDLRDVRDWLRQSDRVKFAGGTSSPERGQAALRQAFTIVELTRRRELPEHLREPDDPDAPSADPEPVAAPPTHNEPALSGLAAALAARAQREVDDEDAVPQPQEGSDE